MLKMTLPWDWKSWCCWKLFSWVVSNQSIIQHCGSRSQQQQQKGARFFLQSKMVKSATNRDMYSSRACCPNLNLLSAVQPVQQFDYTKDRQLNIYSFVLLYYNYNVLIGGDFFIFNLIVISIRYNYRSDGFRFWHGVIIKLGMNLKVDMARSLTDELFLNGTSYQKGCWSLN